MPEPLALTLSLVALGATLVAAVVRSRWLPESLVAAVGAIALIAVGALSVSGASAEAGRLGSTLGLLAALLVLADGCRREGLFDAIGATMARAARGDPRRLLALVFLCASSVTAVLSLDATVVLLTPVVFATAARLRANPKPHLYACLHLANTSSLLLPVSNLTNLLAFRASGLSFTRFAAVMALPWLTALAVEWVVLNRAFRGELAGPAAGGGPAGDGHRPAAPPRRALVIVGLTLVGFLLSSPLGLDLAWIAAAGAAGISAPALANRTTTPLALAKAAEPAFLVFVLGLGVIVRASSTNGLATAVGAVLPPGRSLPDLLAIAALSAMLANLVNNIPATLVIIPVIATAGPAAVLAALIGVNIGPNLTYTGSLATLLWRRMLQQHDSDTSLGEFVWLGGLSVPAGVIASTTVLWLVAPVLT
jgi:arsenical pump membrane protein